MSDVYVGPLLVAEVTQSQGDVGARSGVVLLRNLPASLHLIISLAHVVAGAGRLVL